MNNPELKTPQTNNPQRPLTTDDLLEIGLRRKWYIIVPLIGSILVSFAVYKFLPKIYRGTTLILVRSQGILEDYVKHANADAVINRLSTINQEILSRTRLEKIIGEFNLYANRQKEVSMEKRVETMRKAILVTVQVEKGERSRDSFTVSFEGAEPNTVMMVTNKLANLFIEENWKVRELQAGKTSEFISKELLTMADRVKRKEQEIRVFKERNMGQLPQQLDGNLRILEQLQQQLRTMGEKIRGAEDRAIIFQGQLEQLKKLEPRDAPPNQGSWDVPLNLGPVTQLSALKRELANVQTRMKETHPDVIDLKKKIAALESQVGDRPDGEGIVVKNLPAPRLDPDTERFYRQLTEQYENAVLEAKRLKDEEEKLRKQMALYQTRIEDTPKQEQGLALLTRDYDQLKTNYQSLLDKKLQAQMAENLERKQKGEQFIILDPAVLPERPIKPDRNRILLVGGFLGIAFGIGLTWFRESLDRSFRTVSDLEADLGIPVLATIPNLKEEKKAA